MPEVGNDNELGCPGNEWWEPRASRGIPVVISMPDCGEEQQEQRLGMPTRQHCSALQQVGWRQLREAKLQAQRPVAISSLFAGLSFYLNGRTGELSHHELKRLLQQHGAQVTLSLSKHTDYLVAHNLCGSKLQKILHQTNRSAPICAVRPAWVSACVKRGQLVPSTPYSVLDDAGQPCVRGTAAAASKTLKEENPSEPAARTAANTAVCSTKSPLRWADGALDSAVNGSPAGVQHFHSRHSSRVRIAAATHSTANSECLCNPELEVYFRKVARWLSTQLAKFTSPPPRHSRHSNAGESTEKRRRRRRREQVIALAEAKKRRARRRLRKILAGRKCSE
eukprot:SAG31_NODE_1547_length_7925_cov_3.563251_10_plen_337_part_00